MTQQSSVNSVLSETDRLVHHAVPLFLARLSNPRLRSLAQRALQQKKQFDRAVLVRIGCEASGGDWRLLKPVFVAVEAMDSSIVLVDDIMDESQYRAGGPPLFRQFGVGKVLAVAFAMSHLANEVLMEFAEENVHSKVRSIQIVSGYLHALRRTWEGQYRDVELQTDGHPKSAVRSYFQMIQETTGFQVGAYLRLGAELCSAPLNLATSLYEFGVALGVLLQIRDDYLDYLGSPKILGKANMSDYAVGKLRLPFILAVKYADSKTRRWIRVRLGQGPVSEVERPSILRAIANPNAVGSLKRLLKSRIEQARRILCELPSPNGPKTMLEELLYLAGGL